MIVSDTPTEEIKSTDSIFLFASARSITLLEQKKILGVVRDFLATWEAHGTPLLAQAYIVYERFLIISVDERHEPASGCSKDRLFHIIKRLGEDLKINFFDRLRVYYLKEGAVFSKTIPEFSEQARENRGFSDTLQVFNLMIQNGKELQESLLQKVEDSWVKKFLE